MRTPLPTCSFSPRTDGENILSIANTHATDDDSTVTVALHVNYVLPSGGNKTAPERPKRKLVRRFEMSGTGGVLRVLEMKIPPNIREGPLAVTQENYTRGQLAKYVIHNKTVGRWGCRDTARSCPRLSREKAF